MLMICVQNVMDMLLDLFRDTESSVVVVWVFVYEYFYFA